MAKIKDLTISELIDYEKASRIICSELQDSIELGKQGNQVLAQQQFAEFSEYSLIYKAIHNEFKKRLKEIV